MAWIAFIIGLVIGFCMGVLAVSLCIVARTEILDIKDTNSNN